MSWARTVAIPGRGRRLIDHGRGQLLPPLREPQADLPGVQIQPSQLQEPGARHDGAPQGTRRDQRLRRSAWHAVLGPVPGEHHASAQRRIRIDIELDGIDLASQYPARLFEEVDPRRGVRGLAGTEQEALAGGDGDRDHRGASVLDEDGD